MPTFLRYQAAPSDLEGSERAGAGALLGGGEAVEDVPGRAWPTRSATRSVRVRGVQNSSRGKRFGCSAAVLVGLAMAALFVVLSKEPRSWFASAVASGSHAVGLVMVEGSGAESAPPMDEDRLEARAECKPINPTTSDRGFPDVYRGWFDVQGCGYCNDYCRWVGNAGSGGDPTEQLEFNMGVKRSFWSCRLAGDQAEQSNPGHFTSWAFRRCVGRGEPATLVDLPKEEAHCKPINQITPDNGYPDVHRGWFDVQGCGYCNDYCRWVGKAGSGGNPAKQLDFIKGADHSFWSCRLAGDQAAQSQPGHFTNWAFRRCAGRGESASLVELPKAQAHCKPINRITADNGYPDVYRGWFDVQGCGYCNDYCRWVGLAGAGGDPAEQLEFNKGVNRSFWSCRLAGDQIAQSQPGHFTNWAFQRCVGRGESASLVELPKAQAHCKPINPSKADGGYLDVYRGWFDVQGCGYCNDYCRWVGNAGSGGNPAEQLEFNKGVNGSFWSCRLAGDQASQSQLGYFTNWAFRRCVGRGVSSTLANDCQDVPGWHDPDRDDCDWYSQGSRCADFGKGYTNDGHTASTACCVCGGGHNISTTKQPAAVALPPSFARAASPSPAGRIASTAQALVVGDAVRVIETGRLGVLAKDDGSATPYRVDFDHGHSIWYSESDIASTRASA